MRKWALMMLSTIVTVALISASAVTAHNKQDRTAFQDSNPSPTDTPDRESLVGRIYTRDGAAINLLSKSLDIWEVNQESGYILAAMGSGEYHRLLNQGYRIEIDQDKTTRISQLNEPWKRPTRIWLACPRLTQNWPGGRILVTAGRKPLQMRHLGTISTRSC
ncbi:MAG: hypothetical protein P8X95_25520 [Anaerolineales bacterium]